MPKREPRGNGVPGKDFFADHPVVTAEGLEFEFDTLAKTMAALVRNPENAAPFAIVVRGGWGRGKTTLLKQVERLLLEERSRESERRSFPLWFNAWKYPSDDTVLAGLLGALLDRLRRGSLMEQLKTELAERSDSIGLGLIQLALPGVKIPNAKRFAPAESKRAFYDAFRRLFAHAWYLLQRPGLGGLTRAVSDSDHRAIDGELERVQRDAILAIFLDDLDRCRPERVRDVLEAINLFLDLPGVCFLLGLDWERVRAQLPETMTERDRELFLEKIVQVAFDLPEVNERGAESYVRGLIGSSGLGPLLERPIEPRESRMERVPVDESAIWGSGDGPADIRGAPGPADGVQVVARVLRSRHPRHIKRMLNDLGIRLAVMHHAGYLGDDSERVPERAVLALHLLHEALGPQLWPKVGTTLSNLHGFFARWTAHEAAEAESAAGRLGTSSSEVDPLGEATARLVREGTLSSYVRLLRGLERAQLDRLVHLGSPPSDEQAGTASVAIRSSLDLLDLKGPAWVRVSGGAFAMGSPDGHAHERPVHTVNVPAFHLSRTPVTNAQYLTFVQETGKRSVPSHWQGDQVPPTLVDHPVVNVSWTDAEAFCTWLSRELGAGSVHLPSEAQWEYAARGMEGRLYPWGKEAPDETRANYDDRTRGTTPVASYPRGSTPEGILDLAGNVWEWCDDSWHESYEGAPNDGSSWLDDSLSMCVLRGGAFSNTPSNLRASCRNLSLREIRSDLVGFRVAWRATGES